MDEEIQSKDLEIPVGSVQEEYAPLLPKQKDAHIFREAVLVTLPLFSGYAALFALQKQLRDHFGITDDDEEKMRVFGAAASFLYFGNLIFRMGHNVVFAFLRPRNRVVVSFLSMITSMLILVSIFVFNVQWLGIVFFAYFFGGIGIGTFEANVLNVCTCCGPQTKLWAVIGIPVGIVVITIGGFLLLQAGVHVQLIYAGVFVMLIIGLFLYLIRIWRTGLSARAPTVSEFVGDIKAFREWLPHVRWHALMMAINMFFVSLLSPGLILYLYEGDPIELKPFSWKIPRNFFFAIYDACFFIGDSSSRKIFYKRRTYVPFVFLIFTVLGGIFAFSTLPLIVPLGGFFVAFGNGSLYAQSCRCIDRFVPEAFNLISLSFWLFIGDIGSTIGSNMIPYLDELVKGKA